MSTQEPESGTESPQAQRLERKEQRKQEREAAESEAAAEVEGKTVTLKVFRYDPEIADKQEPRFDTFHVPFEEGMTVLDALIYARDQFDSSLTFRHSCRQAVCGSDALFINGSQRLGCQTQISDLNNSEVVRVEPLPHRDVVKDLVVDMEHFYEQMHAVDPFFDPDEEPDGEQLQSRENREKVKMSTRCIWCGACMSSCNIAAGDNEYLGPAAINKAYRFYFDEREGEEKQQERLEIIEQEHGVWRCQTQFSCTTVCPKDIPLTEHIQELKREAVKSNLKFW
ncbi:succinate dehydrogenase/fumarate reductase iron-sulfur subunit [Halospeciosus flavus]|uniref:Succinate dehydrogenase/fumarate reductase iron-sulfur subunit n=1 Tax=Halospeciosus flavus TaxID=3032283 RepID=A0ABD5Z264_9EURY|nr:succinate dehydrogenase/fumarate reductase iron-sulfur subunit [Halospeciosus flavus]